ncbi:hypothetical protein [Burkholderia lata]|uniref:Uncharacterized protein n=1 Tax=Burkholderia lata (strain ATCC 17760 / DSM 23089 / LMG 22485 / NCIMB 9086 / R18194 / 383) TaxID=482957 RepID=A0A6P2GRJ1_BURL3|nr:hypothetical protein [Burkholderia lata]VWB07144.1 hypothetical protein BLA6863_00152 [Burkholderia lata]
MATTITPQIVNLTAVLTVAPAPSQLQQSGAFVSVGGTTLTTGTYQYCSQLSALTSILSAAGNYAELQNMGNSFYAQGQSVGAYVLELGTQATGAAGMEALYTWITNNPGVFYAYLLPAAWDNTSEVIGSVIVTAGGSGYTAAPTVGFTGGGGSGATATATIANGSVTGVTITNPGSGYTSTPTVTFTGGSGTGAAATANLASELNIVASNFASPTGRTYFFVTTTVANVATYQPNKSVYTFVPSPTATSQEFGAAAHFYQWLVNNPSATSQLAPMAYRFLNGVTAWPSTGYAANIQTVLSAYGNLNLVPPQGGITEVCLYKGMTMDGSQAAWWYGIDWYQIRVVNDLALEVINGSNENPPLLYDQNGINHLAAVAQSDLNTAISFGCALSGSVTATSFQAYTTANPANYKAGIYSGLAVNIVGQNGFLQIGVTLDAIQFA